MDNNEYELLVELRDNISDREDAKREILKLEKKLQNRRKKLKSGLDSFDKVKEKEYIEETVGKAPSRKKKVLWGVATVLSGGLATAGFVNETKRYKSKTQYYNQRVDEEIQNYYERYENERGQIEDAEADRYSDIIIPLKKAKENYDLLDKAISEANYLDDNFKTVEMVNEILRIFDQGRADTIDKAVAIWGAEEVVRKKSRKIKKENIKREKKRNKEFKKNLK